MAGFSDNRSGRTSRALYPAHTPEKIADFAALFNSESSNTSLAGMPSQVLYTDPRHAMEVAYLNGILGMECIQAA